MVDNVIKLKLTLREEYNILKTASLILEAIRKAKSNSKRSLKSNIEQIEVYASGSKIGLLEDAKEDLKDAGNIREILFFATSGEGKVIIKFANESDTILKSF